MKKVKVIDLGKADGIGKLPEQVGQASFGFLHDPTQAVTISESEPLKKKQKRRKEFVLSILRTKFIWLSRRQFLVQRRQGSNVRETFWGGFDGKNPFLIKIKQDLFTMCVKKGSCAFYRALKPPDLIELEKKFRVKSKHQGRFYFLPLPQKTFGEFLESYFFISSLVKDLKPLSVCKVNGYNIGGSREQRHFLTGSVIDSSENPVMHIIVSGTVTAPGYYPPLKLGERPHAFFCQRDSASEW